MLRAKILAFTGTRAYLSLAHSWHDIRDGSEAPSVANISELFERLSYYAAFAVMTRYLHEVLQFPLRSKPARSRVSLADWCGSCRYSAARWPIA